jgi:hypothetical protein
VRRGDAPRRPYGVQGLAGVVCWQSGKIGVRLQGKASHRGMLNWYTFYNFCRVHRSLRMTPAMAAGIADHIWSVRELLEGP